jgi:hypothetical protein
MEKAMDSLARFEPVGLAALSLRPCRESTLAIDKRENLTLARREYCLLDRILCPLRVKCAVILANRRGTKWIGNHDLRSGVMKAWKP